MASDWRHVGPGLFIQQVGGWTHKAQVVADGFEFVATEHRGNDYYVPVPVHVLRSLLTTWDAQHKHPREKTMATRTLWRPVGEEELEKIAALGWAAFPARLPDQPIFYPVCNEEYACQIAQRWNAKNGQHGYVLRFEVDEEYLKAYPTNIVGSRIHEEYWIPADQLEAFNQAIVGPLTIVREFG